MEQPPMRQALSRKEPEFIDHSLLAPTYIRDSNNYIIDFIESTPLVFPNKTVGSVSSATTHTTAATTAPSTTGGYNAKVVDGVTLTSDLHFPSSIFHYRPTQSEVSVSNVASVAEETLNVLNTQTQSVAPLPLVISGGTTNSPNNNNTTNYSHNKHSEYIAINSDYLTGSESKHFCNEAEVVSTTGEDAAVQEILLTDANVSLDDAAELMNSTCDVAYARNVSNARKALPHKKRISRKLRVSLSGANNVLPQPLAVGHKLQKCVRLNISAYSCEICGRISNSQLQFFAHLKHHYEPSTPDTILAAMKTSMEDLAPQKLCAVDNKSPTGNVEQVFNDVHLNFPDFSAVDETPIRHVMEPTDDGNEMKMLNATGMSKCLTYVAQAASPPLKRTVEVEFSDSEDMLEGIRNVVDKVSIEDTCDALDLMTSNGMRGPWFATDDNFNGITFKNKQYNDATFAEPLPPMSMIANSSLTRDTPPKEPAPLPPAEKLLSYQKSDDVCKKIGLALPPEDNGMDDAVAEEENRATFYNDSLPPIRLPSVDADVPQLHLHSPSKPTTPTDFLEPLRASQFELPKNIATQATIEDELLTTVVPMQQVEDEIDGSVIVEDEVFCKEEPDTRDYEGKEVTFDEPDQGIESYTPSPVQNIFEGCQKKYPCTKCGRELNSRNALKYHLRTHTGLRPHQCDMCGKSFYALSALKAHTRTHTGDKPFECEFCQRHFRQWGDLKYHVVSKHTEDKNHQCEFCGKAFSRKYSLVLHRRIHTSERNFMCEYCHKTFRASTYLQDHRKIHTGEKPNECKVCSKRFRMHGDLRRHERIHLRNDSKKSLKKEESEKIV